MYTSLTLKSLSIQPLLHLTGPVTIALHYMTALVTDGMVVHSTFLLMEFLSSTILLLPAVHGPVYYYFPVNTGSSITTTFTAGSWACEPYYYVYNSDGAQVFYVPNNCNPTIYAGQLYGVCPTFGSVEGYVFNYDGLAISGATVAVESGASTTTGPDGYYFLDPVMAGEYRS